MNAFPKSRYLFNVVSCLVVITFISCSEDEGDDNSITPTIEISTTIEDEDILNAINFTADIWEETLVLHAPVRINLVIIPFNTGFLGRAIPNGLKDFTNAPVTETWYPSALAKQLARADLNPEEFDMDILINGTRTWYFGTDGNPTDSQYDFVSLLLHEIAHGLGHGTLAGIESNGFGAFSLQPNLAPYVPSFQIPALSNLPTVFDFYLVNNNQNLLLETYTNPSLELGVAFTSDQIFFNGPMAQMSNQNASPKLYAPEVFQDGSSLSHLDEETYNNSENALMTPFLNQGEVIHEPGPITLGVLQDLGWELK